MSVKYGRILIVLITVFTIVLSCFIPALAVSADANTYDFFSSAEYKYSFTDSNYQTIATPTYYLENKQDLYFRWDVSDVKTGLTGFDFSRFYSTFYVAGSVPSGFSVYFLSNNRWELMTKSKVQEYYYQFSHVTTGVAYREMGFHIHFNASYTGTVSIMDVHVFDGDTVKVKSIFGRGYSTIIRSGGNGIESRLFFSNDYYTDHFSYSHELNISDNRWISDHYFLRSVVDNSSIVYADKLTFIIRGYSLHDFGAVLKSDTTDISVLPVTVTQTSIDSHYESSSYSWLLNCYRIDIDLTDTYIEPYAIELGFTADPFYTSGGETTSVYVVSSFYTVPKQDIPWYKTMYDWLADKIDSISGSLPESQIVDRLDTMIDGSASQQSQADTAVGTLDDSGDSLSSLSSSMELEQPDVSGMQTSITDWISPSVLSSYNAPILALWESPTLVSMLIIVVTLALVSFVFFGKK